MNDFTWYEAATLVAALAFIGFVAGFSQSLSDAVLEAWRARRRSREARPPAPPLVGVPGKNWLEAEFALGPYKVDTDGGMRRSLSPGRIVPRTGGGPVYRGVDVERCDRAGWRWFEFFHRAEGPAGALLEHILEGRHVVLWPAGARAWEIDAVLRGGHAAFPLENAPPAGVAPKEDAPAGRFMRASGVVSTEWRWMDYFSNVSRSRWVGRALLNAPAGATAEEKESVIRFGEHAPVVRAEVALSDVGKVAATGIAPAPAPAPRSVVRAGEPNTLGGWTWRAMYDAEGVCSFYEILAWPRDASLADVGKVAGTGIAGVLAYEAKHVVGPLEARVMDAATPLAFPAPSRTRWVQENPALLIARVEIGPEDFVFRDRVAGGPALSPAARVERECDRVADHALPAEFDDALAHADAMWPRPSLAAFAADPNPLPIIVRLARPSTSALGLFRAALRSGGVDFREEQLANDHVYIAVGGARTGIAMFFSEEGDVRWIEWPQCPSEPFVPARLARAAIVAFESREVSGEAEVEALRDAVREAEEDFEDWPPTEKATRPGRYFVADRQVGKIDIERARELRARLDRVASGPSLSFGETAAGTLERVRDPIFDLAIRAARENAETIDREMFRGGDTALSVFRWFCNLARGQFGGKHFVSTEREVIGGITEIALSYGTLVFPAFWFNRPGALIAFAQPRDVADGEAPAPTPLVQFLAALRAMRINAPVMSVDGPDALGRFLVRLGNADPCSDSVLFTFSADGDLEQFSWPRPPSTALLEAAAKETARVAAGAPTEVPGVLLEALESGGEAQQFVAALVRCRGIRWNVEPIEFAIDDPDPGADNEEEEPVLTDGVVVRVIGPDVGFVFHRSGAFSHLSYMTEAGRVGGLSPRARFVEALRALGSAMSWRSVSSGTVEEPDCIELVDVGGTLWFDAFGDLDRVSNAEGRIVAQRPRRSTEGGPS